MRAVEPHELRELAFEELVHLVLVKEPPFAQLRERARFEIDGLRPPEVRRQLAEAKRQRGEHDVLGREEARVGKKPLEDAEAREQRSLQGRRAPFVCPKVVALDLLGDGNENGILEDGAAKRRVSHSSQRDSPAARASHIEVSLGAQRSRAARARLPLRLFALEQSDDLRHGEALVPRLSEKRGVLEQHGLDEVETVEERAARPVRKPKRGQRPDGRDFCGRSGRTKQEVMHRRKVTPNEVEPCGRDRVLLG